MTALLLAFLLRGAPAPAKTLDVEGPLRILVLTDEGSARALRQRTSPRVVDLEAP